MNPISQELAERCGASHLSSLNFSFLTYKVKILIMIVKGLNVVIFKNALHTAITLISILQMGNVTQTRRFVSHFTADKSQSWGIQIRFTGHPKSMHLPQCHLAMTKCDRYIFCAICSVLRSAKKDKRNI